MEDHSVHYYCQVSKPFSLENVQTVSQINLLKHSSYSYDLYTILFPFRENLSFGFIPGDVTFVPEEPTFVKSRPINNSNHNSILLPLDSYRHFKFVNDSIPFREKNDSIVWRGAAYQKHRIDFLRKCSRFPFADLGNTAVGQGLEIGFVKPWLSIFEQLRSKFVVSIEGNDVATNLKWIMSSNSVCMMPEPKFETWYKEGSLRAGYHYIKIASDYSDFEEQYRKYLANPDECERIIHNANEYANSFRSAHKRLVDARRVVSKYQNLYSVK